MTGKLATTLTLCTGIPTSSSFSTCLAECVEVRCCVSHYAPVLSRGETPLHRTRVWSALHYKSKSRSSPSMFQSDRRTCPNRTNVLCALYGRWVVGCAVPDFPDSSETRGTKPVVQLAHAIGLLHGRTSKASTRTQISVESAFFRPVTSNVKVWLASASPVFVKSLAWTPYVGDYVPTSPAKLPSRYTRAVLASGPR